MSRQAGARLRVASRWLLPTAGAALVVLFGSQDAFAANLTVTPTTPAGATTTTPLTWDITSADGSPTSCELDRGSTVVAPLADCATRVSYDVSAQPGGRYTLVVYNATAAAVVAGATPETASSAVDVAPPAPAPSGPTGPSKDRSPTWQLGLPTGATGSCTVTDAAGTVVDSANPCPDPWTAQLGAGAASGVYTLTVTATANGLTSAPARLGYTLDVTPPAAPSVTASRTPDNSRQPTFTIGNVEAGGTVTCTAGGPAGSVPVTACTSTGATLDLAGQADGDFTLRVTVTDAAGNTGPAGSDTYTLDTTPPTAPVVTAPTSPGRDRTPSFSVAEPDAGVTYSCTASGPAGPVPVTTCGPSTTLDLAGQPDGLYTLTVTVRDAAGNPARDRATYTLDTTAPTTPTISRSRQVDNDPSPSFTVTEPDADATLRCSVTGPSPATVTTCGPTTTLDLSAARDGDYVLTVVAVDAAGNRASATFTYTLDTVAPTVPQISGPAIGNSTSPTFTVTEPDLDATLRCNVSGPGTATVTTCAASTILDLSTAIDGVYVLTVTAVDPAGNRSSASFSYTFDSTPPPAPVISPADSTDSSRTPTLSVTDAEAGVIFTCRVSGPSTVTFLSCGPSTQLDLSGARDGVYTVTVTARDAAGNRTPATTTYTLDTTPPTTPTITGPAGPGASRSPSYAVTEPDPDATLSCGVTGPAAATVTCGPTATLSLPGVDGTYVLTVVATDPYGNSSVATFRYVLDTTPPPAPAVSGIPARVGTTSVTATISDAEAGVALTCRVLGPQGEVVFSGNCPASGTFSTAGHADGTYSLTVTATDSAGNTASTSVSWTQDTTPPPPPVVTVTDPTNSLQPQVTITDAEAGVSLTCRLTGPLGERIFTGTCPASGTFDTTAYGDGRYTLVVTATDSVGNTASTTVTWTRDTVAPPRPTVNPGPSPTNVVAPTVTITDAEAGVILTCRLTGPAGESVFSGRCPADGVFDTTGHGDGTYVLQVVATDAAGNSSSRTVTWVLDTAPPPAPAVSSPPTLTNARSVTLTISDAEPGVSLTCLLTSPRGRTVFSGSCPASGIFDTSGFADGTYTLDVTATDAAGNSARTTVSWVRDTVPPPAPTVSGVPALTNSLVVTPSVSDTEAGVTFTCTLVGPGGATLASGACPPGGYDTAGRSDGTYTLTVTATDAAGNSASTTVTWTRDTTPPPPPVVGAPSSPSRNLAPSFTVTDTEAGVSWRCSVSGPGPVTVTSCGPTTALDLASAADGTYVLSVFAVDPAGNVSAAGRATYVLDTVAPPGPSISAPPALTNSRTVTLTISDPQADATLTCSLTSPLGRSVYNGLCPADGTFDTTGFGDGTYTLVVTASDAAGNVSSASVSWIRDTRPPVAPTVTAPTSPATGRLVTFTVTASESPVGWTCTVNGPAPAPILACGPNSTVDLTGLPDGTYTLTVTATDPAGNVSLPTSASYTLDTTAPPPPTVMAPGVTGNDRTPTFTVTDSESGVRWSCTVTGPAAVTVSQCGPSTTLNLLGAVDGTYVVSVVAIDAAGNRSAATTASYLLDTTAPPAPTVGVPRSPGAVLQPTFAVTDAESGVRLTCALVAPSGRTVASGACPPSGTFDTATFSDGTYTLTVTATDAAGNTSSTTVTWVRDTIAPPAPGIIGPSRGQTRTPSFTVTDSEAGVRFTCTVNGPSVVAVAACGATTRLDLTGGADGHYVLTVLAVDAAGNASPVAVFDYLLDTTAPTPPTVSGPTSPAQGRRPAFTIGNVEPGGVLTCQLIAPAGAAVSVPAACGALVTLDLTGAPDGAYTLTVTVTDAVGNVSRSTSATYVLDTLAPQAPGVTAPLSPGNNLVPTFTITAEPGAVLSCTVARYFQVLFTRPCGDGTFDLSGYGDGEFEITVTATDAAGNTSAAGTAAYLLDTTPPAAPSVVTPASPSPVQQPQWLISGEAGATATCVLTRRGATVAGPVPCTGSYTADLRGQPDGTYTLTVFLTDAAGNTSPVTTSVFILDRTAPVPPTVTPPASPGSDTTPTWRIRAPAGIALTCTLLRGQRVIFGPAACPASGTFSLAGLPDGTYTLRVTGRDGAGNVSATSVTTYVLDTTPPAAPRLDYGTASPSTERAPYWGFTLPADTVGRCELSRDGTVIAVRACSGAVRFDLTGRSAGTYVVRIVAVDDAGNQSAPLVIRYVLGHARPVPPTGPPPTPPTPPTHPSGTPGPNAGHGGTPPAANPDSLVRQTLRRLNALTGSVSGGISHVVHRVVSAVPRDVLPRVRDRFTENVSSAVQGVVNAVSHAGGGTGFPLLLLLVVFMFLVVQNRIDRRDPKLALASVAADDTVEFTPPPSQRGDR